MLTLITTKSPQVAPKVNDQTMRDIESAIRGTRKRMARSKECGDKDMLLKMTQQYWELMQARAYHLRSLQIAA